MAAVVFCTSGVQSLAGPCCCWWVTPDWKWFPSSWHFYRGQGTQKGHSHTASPLQHFPAKATRVTKAPCVSVLLRNIRWFASLSPPSLRSSNPQPPGCSSPLSVEQPLAQ